ncbi:hypothetical protein FFF34_012700 [Inquilinus sp. KBS0705]|nr:hypothetical protein FFF34_012700 [Inquilinus sp. KBS0705]
MKHLFTTTAIILCLLVSACSKKSEPAPEAPHTIKITASATADFAVIIYTADSFGGTQTEVKNITVAKGTSFEYSTQAAVGSYVFVKLSSDVSNSISYKIYNNGTIADQESGKIFATHTTATISYTVK